MSTTAAASTATMTIKSFYRIFLKEARHMNDYNFREYAVRRVRQGFRDPRHAALSEYVVVNAWFCEIWNVIWFVYLLHSVVAVVVVMLFVAIFFIIFVCLYNCRQERQQVLHEAQEQLAVLQRQVILGKLYPSGKSVME